MLPRRLIDTFTYRITRTSDPHASIASSFSHRKLLLKLYKTSNLPRDVANFRIQSRSSYPRLDWVTGLCNLAIEGLAENLLIATRLRKDKSLPLSCPRCRWHSHSDRVRRSTRKLNKQLQKLLHRQLQHRKQVHRLRSPCPSAQSPQATCLRVSPPSHGLVIHHTHTHTYTSYSSE